MINWSVSHFSYLISVLRIWYKSFRSDFVSGSCLNLVSDPNSGSGSRSETGPKFFCTKICMQPVNTKCNRYLEYLEYHSVSPPRQHWDPPHPLKRSKCVPPSFGWGGGLFRIQIRIRIQIQIPVSNPDPNPGSGSESWIRIQIWNWPKLFLY